MDIPLGKGADPLYRQPGDCLYAFTFFVAPIWTLQIDYKAPIAIKLLPFYLLLQCVIYPYPSKDKGQRGMAPHVHSPDPCPCLSLSKLLTSAYPYPLQFLKFSPARPHFLQKTPSALFPLDLFFPLPGSFPCYILNPSKSNSNH